jgi:epoxyqueuosine reductase
VELIEVLRGTAARLGLAGLGVCSAAPFTEVRTTIEQRVDEGRHGSLRFTYADPATATDVRRSFAWAERLVVAAWSYAEAAGSPGPPEGGTGRIARFATEDHYRELRAGLAALAETLRDEGWRAEPLADDNRLVDRAAAVRAGVGWWGKSSMVLAPGPGPWLLLGSVVTDAEVPVTAAMRRDCGTCDACLPACPTGALVAPGVLDARRCLAAWAQAPGVIPAEFREPMGDRLYGCDDCLDACPPGRRALDARPAGRVDLREVLAASDRDLLDRFAHWYVPRRHPRHIRRNALVALGNAGGSGAVRVAAGYLGHSDWLLRAHAAWALGRLGGPRAVAALAAAAGREEHPDVAAEIEAAAGTLAG